jgi:predicted ATP-dependent endonuclease of OLD family
MFRSRLQTLAILRMLISLISAKSSDVFYNALRWEYGFKFYDIARESYLGDINSLSAGQKAILHLVFEAYGRGEIEGGLILIDEPEIHLHSQLQQGYLELIREIEKDEKCQFILVTHSECFVNSNTIRSVKRFALDSDNGAVANQVFLRNFCDSKFFER